jgi:glutamine amidotransferase
VQKAFDRLVVKAFFIQEPKEIDKADKIILPGVGHFATGIQQLKSTGFYESIMEFVISKRKPILGICLGMQLLTDYSEEGNASGLGLVGGITQRFSLGSLKIPHMGWNNLIAIKNNVLLSGIDANALFYFVHSYYVTCVRSEDIIAETLYGISFASLFQKENVFGCQFHPEKSHDAGLSILKNFADF